jgi:septation ring formation regulator EzrA
MKLYFDRDYYFELRARVLATTTGANIHKINGLLGNVLNGCSNYVYSYNHGDLKEANRRLAPVNKALVKLGIKDELEFLVRNCVNMTPDKFKDLADRFEDFQKQKTFRDTDIDIEYSRAYDYYTDKYDNADVGFAFANFVAGYLKAKLDAEQGSLL